jgi:predicted secreted protein
MLDPALNVAIFLIWWWIALFAFLPFGVRSVGEAGVEATGHDQGAPEKPLMWRKALWAAVAAAILWALTAAVIALDPLHLGS